MTKLIDSHKLLHHLQTRLEQISNLAEADEHFEEAANELRLIREEILAGKFNMAIWD